MEQTAQQALAAEVAEECQVLMLAAQVAQVELFLKHYSKLQQRRGLHQLQHQDRTTFMTLHLLDPLLGISNNY
jgi:hypothetical protein